MNSASDDVTNNIGNRRTRISAILSTSALWTNMAHLFSVALWAVIRALLSVTPALPTLHSVALPLPHLLVTLTLSSSTPVSIVTMTIPLLSPPPLLLHGAIDPLVHLLHPHRELSVVQVLLDQGEQEPVPELTLCHHSLDHPVVLQVVADVGGLEHGYPQVGEDEGQGPAEAADDGDDDEEEEPEPLHQEDLVVDDVEAENAEGVVNVDCSCQRSRGELTGGDGGEDLTHRVHHVLSRGGVHTSCQCHK